MALTERQVIHEEACEDMPSVEVRGRVVPLHVKAVGGIKEHVLLGETGIVHRMGERVVGLEHQSLSHLLAQGYVASIVVRHALRSGDVATTDELSVDGQSDQT